MIGGFNKLRNLPPAVLWSVLAVVIVVVGVGGFFLFYDYIYNENQGDDIDVVARHQLTQNTNADTTIISGEGKWEIYTNDELGFQFSYPSELGEVNDELLRTNDIGTFFRLTFGDGNLFAMYGNSSDAAPQRTEHFRDLRGYTKDDEGIYHVNGFETSVEPTETLLINGEEILVVKADDFSGAWTGEEGVGEISYLPPPETGIGALLNAEGDISGYNFLVTDLSLVSADLFKQILATFKFTNAAPILNPSVAEQLFLATAGDHVINIDFYDPAQGIITNNYTIPVPETLTEFSSNSAWGTNYAVQYDETSRDVFFVTQGSSSYDGKCLNPDGTCDNRLYKYNLKTAEKHLIANLDVASGNWAFDSASDKIFTCVQLGRTQRIQLIDTDSGAATILVEQALGDDINSSRANIVVDANGDVLQAWAKTVVGYPHYSILNLDEIDVPSGKITTTEIVQHTTIEYETTISLSGDYITYSADDGFVLNKVSDNAEHVIYSGQITNHNKTISIDGSKVGYIANGLKYYDRNTEVSKTIQDGAKIFPLVWSQNSRYIAYTEPPLLYVYDVVLGNSMQVEANFPSNLNFGSIVGVQWVSL